MFLWNKTWWGRFDHRQNLVLPMFTAAALSGYGTNAPEMQEFPGRA
jgi:hypothetical protein